MNHEIVFKAMWLLIALGNVLFFVVRGSYIFEPSIVSILYYLIGQPLLPEICFGPVTFQVNIHTLLVTSLAKWDQAKQVQNRIFVTTAIWLSSSLFPNLPNLSPRHQPCDYNQVLRLDLKIILPLLATSTFVFITVAAVSNFLKEYYPKNEHFCQV